jgi:hypothetical protein
MRNTFVPMLVAAAVLATPAAVLAQDSNSTTPDPPMQGAAHQVSVTGSVVRNYAGQLELQSGQIIYINDATVFKTNDVDLYGVPVSITGYQNGEDGSINATEIDTK